MTNPIEGAKDLLVTAGVGTFAATSGWSINLGKEPTGPHTTITLFNTGGSVPNPKWLLDYPSFQVRVRGAPGGYSAAWSKAAAVKDALLGIDSQDINGDRWVSVTMAGDINFIGMDQSNRPLFTLNFRMIVEPASGTNRDALA